MKYTIMLFFFVFAFYGVDRVDAAAIQLDDGFKAFDDFYDVNKSDLKLLQSTAKSALYTNEIDLDYMNGLFDNYSNVIGYNSFSINMYNNKLDKHSTLITRPLRIDFLYPVNLRGYYINMELAFYAQAQLYIELDDGTTIVLKDFYNDSENNYYTSNYDNVKSIVFHPGDKFVENKRTLNEIEFFVDPTSIYSSVTDFKLESLKDKSVTLNWKNPVHSKFTGNKVYLNDDLVSSSTGVYTNFHLKNLSPNTNYQLKVAALYGDIEVYRILDFRTLEAIDDIPPLDITHLKLLPDVTSISVSFNGSLSDDISFYQVYRNNKLIISDLILTHFIDSDLEEDTTYIYKIIGVDFNGNKNVGVSKSIKTLSTKDTTPPDDVSNLAVVEDYTQTNMRMGTLGIKQINALITYDFPSDDDFSHVEILRNDQLLNSMVNSNRYMDLNIGEKQTYKYTVKSVDYSGNKSKGENVYLNTTYIPDTFAPEPPTGLNVSRNNSGGKLSWLKNNESDFDGYNVYVNGTKYNTDLVKTTSQVLKSLENGTTYQLTVTAVDWSGNESAHSAAIDLVPDKNASTDVNLSENYNLKDVADGTANWFASLWWIVAFVVGIALAFILGRRFKELFLGS